MEWTRVVVLLPSKTKDFDMHKAWDIGKHTLLAGMAYRSESFDQTRYTLDQWRNLDTGNELLNSTAAKTNPGLATCRINGRLLIA